VGGHSDAVAAWVSLTFPEILQDSRDWIYTQRAVCFCVEARHICRTLDLARAVLLCWQAPLFLVGKQRGGLRGKGLGPEWQEY